MYISKWKKLKKNKVFNTKWFEVTKNCVQLPHNNIILDDYYVVEAADSAMIVAVDENLNIIMKHEYRFPVDEILLELPAGNLEVDEEPQQAAQRELYEETGYVSDKWSLLSKTYDCPNRCNNALYIFLAENAQKVSDQHLDNSENITVKTIPISQAVEMCMDGRINVNSCVHGILHTAIKLNPDKM